MTNDSFTIVHLYSNTGLVVFNQSVIVNLDPGSKLIWSIIRDYNNRQKAIFRLYYIEEISGQVKYFDSLSKNTLVSKFQVGGDGRRLDQLKGWEINEIGGLGNQAYYTLIDPDRSLAFSTAQFKVLQLTTSGSSREKYTMEESVLDLAAALASSGFDASKFNYEYLTLL